MPIVALMTVLALTTTVACSSKSAPADRPSATGLDVAHVQASSGTTGLADMLADATAFRDAFFAALPGMGKAGDDLVARLKGRAKFGADLLTPAGWSALGVDVGGELAVVFDDRVSLHRPEEKPVPAPILLVKLSDRDKLLAAAKELGVSLSIGPADGAVEPLLVDGKPQGFIAAFGDRSAIVAAMPQQLDAIRGGFAAFVAGGGDALAESDKFRRVMRDSPGGAGIFGYFTDFANLAPFGDFLELREDDLRAYGEGAERIMAALAFQLGQDGFTLRATPSEAMAKQAARAAEMSGKPPDFGAYVPAKGWAIARGSLEIKTVMSLFFAIFGDDGEATERLLSPTGITPTIASDALSGHFAVALDLNGVPGWIEHDGPLPSWLAMVGVKDGAAADELVKRVLGILKALAGEDLEDRVVDIDGHEAHVLKAAGQTLAFVRVDDMLIASWDAPALAAALARKGDDAISDSDFGKPLREEISFACAAELSPLVAWFERASAASSGAAMPITKTSRWAAIRERPILTVRAGWDGDAQFVTVRDTGLTYTYALQWLTSLVLVELANGGE